MLVVAGWLVAQQSVGKDVNQILRIYLPGDLVAAVSDEMPFADLVSVTRLSLIHLPAAVTASEPFQSYALNEARRRAKEMMEHAVRLGRLDARQRMASFLLEIDRRWRAAHPEAATEIPFAMKQTQIADYLALSQVHVNRTLTSLKRDRLIEVRHQLTILDRAGLARVCGAGCRSEDRLDLHLA